MNLADRIYEQLKFDIITCALKPGEQVVQKGLAEKYNTGTTPVREALQRLVHEGFVEAVPRIGYMVTPVTISDLQEIYELRSVLECAAVRLAAERGSEESLREIERSAHFEYQHGNRESYVDFLNHNANFHRNVASASGNQRLAQSVSKVLSELNRVFHMGLDLRDSREEMRAEHTALAEALLAHDPDLAEEIARKQIQRSQQRVIEALLTSSGISLPQSPSLL